MKGLDKLFRVVVVSAAFMSPPVARADAIYLSKSAFVSLAGQRVGATFDDVPTGRLGPFTSGSVYFPTNSLRVADSYPVPDATHALHFGSEASAPNFAAVAGTTWDFIATFALAVRGAGFVLNCVACDVLANDSALDWSTYDASGRLIESGTVTVDLSVARSPSVKFFGLLSDQPFRTISVRRRIISQPAVLATWVVDDIRLVPDADSASAVPTLTHWGVVATIACVLVIGALGYRRVA